MNNFLWRWLDPDATQHSRREPGTKIGFCNFDGKITFAAHRRQLRLQQLEGQVVYCRWLAGDAVVIHRVGLVDADPYVEDGVLSRAPHRFWANPRTSNILRHSLTI